MKKCILILGLSALLVYALIGCSKSGNEDVVQLLPGNLERVGVTYWHSGKETKWEIEHEEMADWKSWVDGLSLKQKSFEEGHTPGDSDGGKSYDFHLNDGETSFSYIITGRNSYILFDGEWYFVSNPKEPPFENGDKEKYAKTPMIMVNGKLYYGTGRENTIEGRCGTMDGEINSTVSSSQVPTKDNQSNFGSGFGYQFGGSETIEVYMDDRWIVFEHISDNDSTIHKIPLRE